MYILKFVSDQNQTNVNIERKVSGLFNHQFECYDQKKAFFLN